MGHIQDPEWKGIAWSDDYLKEKAGLSEVKVETRGIEGVFGTGLPKSTMKFGELVDKLRSGSDHLYMTTQYSDEEPPSRKEDDLLREFCPPPLTDLLHDFPLRPSLLGNLVPQQVNLWMGNSKHGSSSGLHHDFHDNLYILLRGRKRFTLFSPADAGYMYTNGKISTVHRNGLINYEGHEQTRSDGAFGEDVLKYEVKSAERELEVLQTNNARKYDIQKAEDKLEIAMDNLLKNGGEIDDYNESSDDDYPVRFRKKQRHTQQANNVNRNNKQKNANEEPPSFSRVDIPSLRSAKSQLFPLLGKAARVVAELSEGEMLYLPASWFHEVTSFNNREQNLHLAFNYWLHPPNVNEFEKPYMDGYWMEKWEKVEQIIKEKKSKGTTETDTTKKRKKRNKKRKKSQKQQ